MPNNKESSIKSAILMAIGTFFLAALISLWAELIMPKIKIITLSFLFLVLIIFIGIIFDIIGIAAAAAREEPFHAKASKKVRGSFQAISIVRNADRVASFCNDVVGDICGTVSGALGAAIVFQLVTNKPTYNESILSVIMTGFVAALTVGGKSAGKRKAITDSEHIVFRVGQALDWLERILGIEFFSKRKNNKNNSKRKGKVRRR